MRLTEEQHNIVKSREGAYLVIASAGSGKTRCITQRVINLLNSGINPNNILCVTFTTKAAKEMKDRIGRNDITICTFHSLAYKAFIMFKDKLEYKDGFEIVSNNFVKSLAVNLYNKHYTTTKESLEEVYTFVNEVSNMKRDYLMPDDYFKGIWVDFYNDLEREMREQNKITFDDLLYKVNLLFGKNEMVKKLFRNNFKYIHLDETQDTNNAQFQFLYHINHTNNIMIVGDPNQSIFRFQGAEVKNIFEFDKKFSPKVLTITQNFRSTKNIINLTNRILRFNLYDEKYRPLAKTDNEIGEIPEYNLYGNQDEQAEGVLMKIERLIEEGYEYKDIAVLYRNNSFSMPFERVFVRNKIPFIVKGGSFINRREIQLMLACLKMGTIGFAEEKLHLYTVISSQFNNQISEKTLQLVYTSDYNLSFENLVHSSIKIPGVGPVRKRGLKELVDFVSDIKSLIPQKLEDCKKSTCLNSLIDELVKVISHKTDNFEDLEQRKEALNDFKSLWLEYFNSNKENKNLKNFINDFTLQFSIEGDDNENEEENAVTLSTIHSFKGLERRAIFIVNVRDGMFPMKPNDLTMEEYIDTINLFYVACSRAEEKLYISSPEEYNTWIYREKTFSLLYMFMNTDLLKNINSYQHILLQKKTNFYQYI